MDLANAVLFVIKTNKLYVVLLQKETLVNADSFETTTLRRIVAPSLGAVVGSVGLFAITIFKQCVGLIRAVVLVNVDLSETTICKLRAERNSIDWA